MGYPEWWVSPPSVALSDPVRVGGIGQSWVPFNLWIMFHNMLWSIWDELQDLVFTLTEIICGESVGNAFYAKAQLTIIDESREKKSHVGNINISTATFVTISAPDQRWFHSFLGARLLFKLSANNSRRPIRGGPLKIYSAQLLVRQFLMISWTFRLG